VFQYSGGVSAEPGYRIERALLAAPLPLAAGFDLVERYLGGLGRPTSAFCACELRSPAPFSEQGFVEFNRKYVQTLDRWGLYREGDNPVARTNVCPEYHKPAEPSLYAFSYTVPDTDGTRGSFITAGGGEAPDGPGEYRNRIVRLGDTSLEGLRDKVRAVMTEMERRLSALGFTWADAITTQMYTVHNIGALIEQELVKRGAASHGLRWHFTRPPVVDIEFEMDVHAPLREIVL
jgi:hypothetical protein